MINEEFVAQRNNFLFYGSTRHRARAINENCHTLFELYRLENGQCTFLIEDTFYSLKPGDVLLIPASTIHSAVYSAPRNDRLLLLCAQQYLPPFAGELLAELGHAYRNPQIGEALHGLLQKIGSESEKWDAYSARLVKGYLQELFVLLARNPNFYKSEHVPNRHVDNVLRILNRDFGSDLSLSTVAKQYGLSPEHLSRIFKAGTGLSFQTYLTGIRLKRARELLCARPQQSISEVADACGYRDSNYFSTRFRQMYGCSPLQYRKRYKEPQEKG